MRYTEVSLCLVYFILQGLCVPNFDDIHYVYLTETCGISSYMYDFLNILAYAGAFVMCIAYNQYLSQYEVRRLIQWQLAIGLGVTVLQFEYALHISEHSPLLVNWQAKFLGDNKSNDVLINSIFFFLGSMTTQMISILPAMVVLTPCIPDNVEAAMTALITGVFVFSTDVGGNITGSLLCN